MDEAEWDALSEKEQQKYIEDLLEKHLKRYGESDLGKGHIATRRERRNG